MKLRNLSGWKLSKSTDGLLFFAQRLDELLFDYSLDTYKPPALNSPYLCIEAIELISEIEKGAIENQNLDPVLEELTWSLQQDEVAKSLLDSEVSYYTLKNEETSLQTTKLRLEVLGRTINPERYMGNLLVALMDAIGGNEKKRIDALATSLITTLINFGVSKRSLFSTTHEYFFSPPKGKWLESSGDFDAFAELIIPEKHEYSVYFVVSSLIRQVSESISAFRLDLVDEVPKAEQEFPVGGALKESEVFVRVNGIHAYDSYSARRIAYGRLDNLSDLFTLFYHRSQIDWRPDALVAQGCCEKKIVVVVPPKGPMEKAFDLKPEKASKELNSLLRNFSARKNRSSFQRFNRVADLHGVCVYHDIADNQLVNLWTALETLVPSHVGGSKINKVIQASTSFILNSYVKGLLETLLFDLTAWDRWRARNVLNKVPSQKGASLQEKLTILIASSDCEALRNDLYAKLGDFHLLRYRCFRLSEMLGSSEKVIDLLERHEKKVAWQIRRLYRARNLIVHTSRSPSYLDTLIENGHKYLDCILFDVIKYSCGEYHASTIEQTFELSSILYRKYRERIKGLGRFDAGTAVLLLGEDLEPV